MHVFLGLVRLFLQLIDTQGLVLGRPHRQVVEHLSIHQTTPVITTNNTCIYTCKKINRAKNMYRVASICFREYDMRAYTSYGHRPGGCPDWLQR